MHTTANVKQRAMILLAINCGFIPCDLGRLRWSDLQAVPGWLELVREKTGVDRRAPLWPETQAALVAVADATGQHAGSLDDLVFRTKAGNPY
ncbi:site-specific integrase [Roseimaritima ulvae]|uniref:Tyr recombinase domain-containing protein n=1 Tax=Roseimaritima ulvae TaxID=980254 RepID=A0A5B9R0I5_9BACT|nr:hypothetical protein [Roseimaritima ulvae]QEG43759.1 hypothetical protein UC8_58140 [Roseimaritima ulvae]